MIRLPSPAMTVALTALFVALTGTAVAGIVITGANVRNSSLTGLDVRNGTLTTLDVNILSENHAALGLIKAMGGTRKEESRGVAEYVIDVAAALEALRSDAGARGVQDVLKQLGAG